MKLFITNSMETVKACQEYFSSQLPSIQLGKHKKRFETKFMIIRVWCCLFSKKLLSYIILFFRIVCFVHATLCGEIKIIKDYHKEWIKIKE